MTTSCASEFKWSRKHGVAHASKLFDKEGCKIPHLLYVKSPLTGITKKFQINEREAINTEWWDGECVTLHSSDGCSITIWNH
jgi:hypothetical protein